jgi:sugar phosphate isomerase/epimerase
MADLAKRLALSTCWCSHRHTDGYAMLAEMRDLGFSRAELSHGIGMILVPGIRKACNEGWMEISSVHNFCPLPSGVTGAAPNLFQPSVTVGVERTLWLRYSRRSLEFAKQVGAGAVVMHSGSVPFLFRSPERILEIPPPGDVTSKNRRQAWERLRKKAGRPTSRVVANYGELLPFARELGIVLGLENREGVLELPLDEDWKTFLDEFPDEPALGYWHDTGHAQIKERLGLLKHREHLEAVSDRIVGFHLHDVSAEGRDHQAPGTGLVDFAMIKEFVRDHHTLVAELGPRLSRDEVLASREYLLESLS